MKIRLVISILLFLFIAFIIVYGNVTGLQTHIENTVIVEAPEPVVWRHLAGIETYDRWCSNTTFGETTRDTLRQMIRRNATYHLSTGSLAIREHIRINETEHSVAMRAAPDYKTSFLDNFQSDFTTESLADGSTSVTWNVRYQIRPVVARTIAHFRLKPAIDAFTRDNLRELKKTIER